MKFSDAVTSVVARVLASSLAGGAVLMVASAPVVSPGVALAQTANPAPNGAARNNDARITLNFRDTDIQTIAEAVEMATHKTFIIDPRVRAQVTMLSSTPVTPDQFYQIFQSILQVHSAIAVPGADGTVKIVPDTNERFSPGVDDLPEHVSSTSDETVTQVIPVKNVSAQQLVTVLRPLVPTTANINALTTANMILITDHAANVSRIEKIVARLDQVSDSDVEVIPMQNASATEVARVLTGLYQGQAQAEPGVQPLKLVADDRTNSIILSGEPSARLRAKALIAHLDTPQQGGGDTRVVYLKYADAEKLAPKLKEQLTGVAQAASGTGTGGAAATPTAQESKNSQVWADTSNNALVITAPPKVMRQIMDIIDKLDIPKAQVLVEAIIVDVDISKSADLGVNWATWEENNGQVIPGATFLSPVGGASLVDLADAITSNGSNINSSLETGGTLAIGRVNKNGLSFAAMLRALRSDSDTNIVATPEALTQDHQEATVKVVEEVPFVTGQYTSSSTVTNGTVTPFQTIQQIEVGTILKITPQINEGSKIALKIDVESSSVIATPSGASGITTSKREVTTNVLIEDGGIVVLGGLISNEYDRTKSQVPLLGDIPLLGELFKERTASQTKTNLMIFLRPQILNTETQMATETNSRYNFMREEQRQVGASEHLAIPLLPGVKSPVLPPMPPPPAPGSKPVAPITEQERDQAAREARREADAEAHAAPPAASSAPQAPK
ncbi:MAG TPA: type II secretion system secretin GspD [Steroidobacteraceae bacterium]|nr:type II secretion system secretin GspD [Steroidobacteraceae bacterium]